MAPIDLNLLRTFTAVYEAGSFTKAADKLGVPRSTVSRAIAALEDALGEQLVQRTTRTLAITAEGKELFDRVSAPLASTIQALADRPSRDEEPSGVVRVTSTPDISAAILAEAAVRFTTRYPQTSVQLVATPRVLDLVRDEIDLAIRVTSRRLPTSGLRAQKVGKIVVKWYAAPSYVARRGAPRNEAELATHDRVGFSNIGPRGVIPDTGGRIVCDDVFVIRELVRSGGGVGSIPSFLTANDIQSGTLVPVLPRVALTSADVYVVMPARKHVASRVAAFRALVMEILRQRPLDPPT